LLAGFAIPFVCVDSAEKALDLLRTQNRPGKKHPFGLVLLWQGWHSPDAQAAELLERYLDREYPSWRELLAFEGPLTREYALALLGLCESASADDVRRAYRERMLLYHPDSGGSSALAARLNEAVAILRKQNSLLASAIST